MAGTFSLVSQACSGTLVSVPTPLGGLTPNAALILISEPTTQSSAEVAHNVILGVLWDGTNLSGVCSAGRDGVGTSVERQVISLATGNYINPTTAASLFEITAIAGSADQLDITFSATAGGRIAIVLALNVGGASLFSYAGNSATSIPVTTPFNPDGYMALGCGWSSNLTSNVISNESVFSLGMGSPKAVTGQKWSTVGICGLDNQGSTRVSSMVSDNSLVRSLFGSSGTDNSRVVSGESASGYNLTVPAGNPNRHGAVLALDLGGESPECFQLDGNATRQNTTMSNPGLLFGGGINVGLSGLNVAQRNNWHYGASYGLVAASGAKAMLALRNNQNVSTSQNKSVNRTDLLAQSWIGGGYPTTWDLDVALDATGFDLNFANVTDATNAVMLTAWPLAEASAATDPAPVSTTPSYFANGETGIVVAGSDFGTSGALVYLNSAADGTGTEVQQTVTAHTADNEITFTCVQGALGIGAAYLFVDQSGQRNAVGVSCEIMAVLGASYSSDDLAVRLKLGTGSAIASDEAEIYRLLGRAPGLPWSTNELVGK